MPLLRISSNVAIEPERRAQVLAEASRRTAELLGKPERYVMVELRHNPAMLFAGTDEPLALLELKSLGLPEQRTNELSAELCAVVAQLLEVAADRIYIEFHSPPRHMWGWNQGTFA